MGFLKVVEKNQFDLPTFLIKVWGPGPRFLNQKFKKKTCFLGV